MKLGLTLFFVGAVLAGINLRVISGMAKREKDELWPIPRKGWTPKLIFVNVLMVIFVLILLAGVVIVFRYKWWLALILLGVIMPFVISLVSGERA